MTGALVTIEEAIARLKAGKMIALLDDEHRENEGDLVIAADYATPEAINFMARFGRGLICLSMAEQLIDKLNLPMMTSNNKSPFGTAFTVSIEAAVGVSTGISAKDRAHTIAVAIHPDSKAQDVITPGHIFPLKACTNGVLERTGQTEGSVDLMKLAGLTPAAVICEIINDDGTMSRRDDLVTFSKQHNIPMVTIRDLIDYRIKHETLVQVAATSALPMQTYGHFAMTVFTNSLDKVEHFALIKAPFGQQAPPLVRIHSECITGDVFGSCRCDCGEQLQQSLELITKEGGILIYMRQEGRGIGLANKMKAYALQEKGFDTVEANIELGLPADARDYAIAYQILKFFGIENVRLLTNNPKKVEGLTKYGVLVSERIPLNIAPTQTSRHYLTTKKDKLGHFINID